MFQNMTIDKAIWATAIFLAVMTVTAIVSRILENNYYKKNPEISEKKTQKQIFRIVNIIIFFITGVAAGSMVQILIDFNTAKSHGMNIDPKTQQYTVTYENVRKYNKLSVKESKININDDLSGKILIYVRYDCKDCIMLHDALSSIQNDHPDIIFLSSRSDTGRTIIEKYGIHLTEVPQGVYIRNNKTTLTVNLMTTENNELVLDMSQVDSLYTLQLNDKTQKA